MRDSTMEHAGHYDPAGLLDAMEARLMLSSDAQLARLLELQPPLISKIRHRHLPVGAAFLIRLHEASGMTIADMRTLLGDRRTRFRIGTRDSSIGRAH